VFNLATATLSCRRRERGTETISSSSSVDAISSELGIAQEQCAMEKIRAKQDEAEKRKESCRNRIIHKMRVDLSGES
jgi:hypothetical protein